MPDARDLWAMGANPLDMSRGAGTFEAARAHGYRIADRVGADLGRLSSPDAGTQRRRPSRRNWGA